MKLSKRLNAIKDLVRKYKQGSVLADIGSDHAYLPCALIKGGVITKAYACDITDGPVKKAIDNVNFYNLSQSISVLKGDGLLPLVDKEVDNVVIAGMGAFNIIDILEAGNLKGNIVYFLQPNSNTDKLRLYLSKNHYHIICEDIVEDLNHIYDILVVKNEDGPYLSPSEIYLGSDISLYSNEIFQKKWRKQFNVFTKVIATLDTMHPDYSDINYKLKIIKEKLDVD